MKRVNKVYREFKVFRESLALKEFKVLKATRGKKARKVNRASRAKKEILVLLLLMICSPKSSLPH